MKINLIQSTPLSIIVESLRTCWNSFKERYEAPTNNITGEDKSFLSKVIKKYKHQSGWEHCVYHFEIKGISRAVLQEFSRHRMQSLSVRSTRYTLKQLKNELPFDVDIPNDHQRAYKYLYMTMEPHVNNSNIKALESLRRIIELGITNDVAKYCLPEAFLTELRCTINARSLNNLLNLRTDKSALKEFQDLANAMFESLPEEHKFLFDIYRDNN